MARTTLGSLPLPLILAGERDLYHRRGQAD